MTVGQGAWRIGTSGYDYAHWRGVFYPKGLPKRGWFEHFAAHFDTVEVNNTFYRLPGPDVFDAWREQAPSDFLFALKFSSYATHRKRLREPAEPIARFIHRAAARRPPRADPGAVAAALACGPRALARFCGEAAA